MNSNGRNKGGKHDTDKDLEMCENHVYVHGFEKLFILSPLFFFVNRVKLPTHSFTPHQISLPNPANAPLTARAALGGTHLGIVDQVLSDLGRVDFLLTFHGEVENMLRRQEVAELRCAFLIYKNP